MIIVEGADHVGKTHLCRMLAKRLGMEIHHLGRLDRFWDYHRDYIAHACQEGVLDRFALSELAYGPVFRSGVNVKFSSHLQRCVARIMNRLGALSVYVHADWKTVAKRLAKQPDDMVSTESEHSRLHMQFVAAMSSNLALGERGVRYYPQSIDTSNRDITDVEVERIATTWALEQKIKDALNELNVESWGSLRPSVLFVGERCNGDHWEPFSGLHGSSETLSALLDVSEIPERAVHFVNAYDIKGVNQNEKIKALWHALGKPLIICLGHLAKTTLDASSVCTLGFPHPQWVRRFHFYDTKEYAQKLHALIIKHGEEYPIC